MKTIKTLLIILIPMLLLTGIAAIGVAYAHENTQMSWEGTWNNVDVQVVKNVGGNLFLELLQEGTWTGPDIEGDITSTFALIIHENGNLNFQGTTTCNPCTVTVGSETKSGSIVFRVVGSRPAGQEVGTGNFAILSATGDLANLQGNAKAEYWSTEDGFTGTYTGRMHFNHSP